MRGKGTQAVKRTLISKFRCRTLPAAPSVFGHLGPLPLALLRSARPGMTSGANSEELRPLRADDGDGADVHRGRAAQIVRHADPGRFELARAGAALKLQVHLVEHAQARGADGMTEAFQAAVDLARQLAVGVVEAVHDVL